MQFFNQNLKDICTSSFACSYKNGYALEARSGRVRFKFPPIISENINLHVRKISGNGKFLCNNQEYICYSKELEVIHIPFVQEIEIARPKDSLGEICIIGWSLDPIPSEGECVSSQWKSIISRCGNYSGIKLVGNKLYAVEGAKFSNPELIDSMITNPANAFSKTSSEIKFNVGAEILNISVTDSLKEITSAVVEPFINREGPMMILSPIATPVPFINPPSLSIYMNKKPTKISAPEVNYNQLIVYDSKNNLDKLHLSGNKLAKHIQSNGQNFVSLKRGGLFSMPLSALRPGGNYIIIVSAQRLSGNGRLYVGFASDNITKYSILGVEAIFYDKNIQISLPPNFESPKLNITMMDDSTGEVLIRRVMVIEDLPTVNRFSLIKQLSTNNSFKNSLAIYPQESIKESTRNSSKFYIEAQSHIIDCSCIIEATTFSSKQWLSKVAPFVNGLKVKDPFKLLIGIEKSNDHPTFLMTKLGKLKPCPNIYLDSWSPHQNISEADLEILKQCKRIVVSSLANKINLKISLNNSDIIIDCLTKPWIFNNTNIGINSDNYCLYFEKNELITRALLDYWTQSMPTLCVVGTNLDSPFYIKKISEFLPWSKLSQLFVDASVILDFDFYNGKSSIIESAISMNKCVVSNNNFYLDHIIFSACDLDNGNNVILDTSNLTSACLDASNFIKEKFRLPTSGDFNAFVKGNL